MFGTAKIAVKRAFSTRTFQAIIMVISAITVITTSTLLSIKTVTVKENGHELITAATFSGTVEKFINASGIVVGEYDKVSPPMLSTLKKNQEINITRAYPLNISVGGQVQTVMAAGQTVAEILEVNNITMDSMDIISPSLDSVVNKNTQITITKVTSDMVPVQEELAFTIIQTPNSNLDRGITRVVQEGKAGTKEVMYNVTYSNGKELSRQAAGERIVTEPVNKIVEYGTKYAAVSRGGNVSRVTDPSTQLNYSKTIAVTATAYDLSMKAAAKTPVTEDTELPQAECVPQEVLLPLTRELYRWAQSFILNRLTEVPTMVMPLPVTQAAQLKETELTCLWIQERKP